MGLECGTNYGYYNNKMYQPQQKVSGGDAVGHFAEKNWNRVVTGAGIAGVGAAGLTAACVANTINSKAPTVGGVISDWLPKAEGDKVPFTRKIFNKAVDAKKGFHAFMNDEGRWGKTAKDFVGKTKDSIVKWCKLDGVVNYFKPQLVEEQIIKSGKNKGNKITKKITNKTFGAKLTSTIQNLNKTIKTSWKSLPAKTKLIALIGMATTATAGLIYGAGKHQAGKIDQKYEDRAKFM